MVCDNTQTIQFFNEVIPMLFDIDFFSFEKSANANIQITVIF